MKLPPPFPALDRPCLVVCTQLPLNVSTKLAKLRELEPQKVVLLHDGAVASFRDTCLEFSKHSCTLPCCSLKCGEDRHEVIGRSACLRRRGSRLPITSNPGITPPSSVPVETFARPGPADSSHCMQRARATSFFPSLVPMATQS